MKKLRLSILLLTALMTSLFCLTNVFASSKSYGEYKSMPKKTTYVQIAPDDSSYMVSVKDGSVVRYVYSIDGKLLCAFDEKTYGWAEFAFAINKTTDERKIVVRTWTDDDQKTDYWNLDGTPVDMSAYYTMTKARMKQSQKDILDYNGGTVKQVFYRYVTDATEDRSEKEYTYYYVDKDENEYCLGNDSMIMNIGGGFYATRGYTQIDVGGLVYTNWTIVNYKGDYLGTSQYDPFLVDDGKHVVTYAGDHIEIVGDGYKKNVYSARNVHIEEEFGYYYMDEFLKEANENVMKYEHSGRVSLIDGRLTNFTDKYNSFDVITDVTNNYFAARNSGKWYIYKFGNKDEVPKLTNTYNGANGIGVQWTKTGKAVEYDIWRKYKGKWSKIKTVKAYDKTLQKSENRLMYTDESVKAKYGQGYIYSVAAVYESGRSDYDEKGLAAYRLINPNITKVVSNGSGKVTVYWNKVACQGYEVQYATEADAQKNKWTKAKEVKYGRTFQTINGLKKGRKYVFRIRCEKTNKDRGTTWSQYSGWKSV